MYIITSNVVREFYRNFLVGKEDECWNWFAGKTGRGYGQIYLKGRYYSAHVVSYCIKNNLIRLLEGCILHSCDNPPCVNPKHLSYGTDQDNMTDKVNKGRSGIGEMNALVKLTEKEVIEIRKRYKLGNVSQRYLSRQYNISQAVIWAIVNNNIWKHVP